MEDTGCDLQDARASRWRGMFCYSQSPVQATLPSTPCPRGLWPQPTLDCGVYQGGTSSWLSLEGLTGHFAFISSQFMFVEDVTFTIHLGHL